MAEVRKVDVPAPEGAGDDHTAYEYQLGEEIDGVWVPFVTKTGGYIDHLVSSGKAAQQADQGSASSSTTQTTANEQNTTTTDAGSGGEPAPQTTGDGGQAA